MPKLILTDVDEDVIRKLKKRASRNHRSSAEEAKAILADAVRSQSGDGWAQVDAIYQRLAASGHAFSDSAELLREDRDR
jgi:plasmid stability protein